MRLSGAAGTGVVAPGITCVLRGHLMRRERIMFLLVRGLNLNASLRRRTLLLLALLVEKSLDDVAREDYVSFSFGDGDVFIQSSLSRSAFLK